MVENVESTVAPASVGRANSSGALPSCCVLDAWTMRVAMAFVVATLLGASAASSKEDAAEGSANQSPSRTVPAGVSSATSTHTEIVLSTSGINTPFSAPTTAVAYAVSSCSLSVDLLTPLPENA